MFLHNGQRLNLDQPFTIGDTNYPPSWLRESTPEMRAELGIVEITWGPRPDDRFYWVQENMDGTYTTTPKDLTQLKETFTAQVDQTAYTMLFPTDWMIVRKIEANVAVPETTTTFRAAVRAAALANRTAIANATTVENLAAVVAAFSWPVVQS
jgi:hypothetical protein